PFLDAGSAGVIDADDGDAVAKRKLLHLDDLLRGHLTERATEDRRVICVHRDATPVDLAEAGDDAVARDLAVLHPKAMRAVGGDDVELHERSLVEQHLDAGSGGRFTGGSALVCSIRGRVQRLITPLAVLVDL